MPSLSRVLSSFLLVLAVVSPSLAQTRLLNRADSLRGIQVIRVIVEDMPAVEERISASVLRSSMEDVLRDAGIRIATADDSALYPILMLRSSIVDVDEPRCFVYNLDLSLVKVLDMPMVDRDEPEPIRANTWDTAMTGIVGTAKVSHRLRDTVDDLMNDFMSDYRAVNRNAER